MEHKLQVLENVPVLASLGEELMKGLAERAEFVAVKKAIWSCAKMTQATRFTWSFRVGCRPTHA